MRSLIFDLIQFIPFFVKFYNLFIFARFILAWVPHNPYHPIIYYIYLATEPLLKFVRRFTARYNLQMFDLIIAMLLVEISSNILIRLLATLL